MNKSYNKATDNEMSNGDVLGIIIVVGTMLVLFVSAAFAFGIL